MKLIFCPVCEDVVKLVASRRYCHCARSYGQYLGDGLHAEIGGEAVPIGFDNHSFARAIKQRPEEGEGSRFEAFIIPVKCDNITKL